jgi:pyridoxamine 5'-phosphate oxidase
MEWHREHLPEPLPGEPLTLALHWQTQARTAAQQPNPDAMVLATVDERGRPQARVVLCKEIVPQPGYLTFFTNYHSAKGRALAAHDHAAVVMHWDHLHRQVRIEGPVRKASAAVSDSYFASRHWQSRLGAWASQQSEPVADLASLQRAMASVAQRFALPMPGDAPQADPGVTIPRPPHWGGYHLWAESVELWVEGSARIHERACWTRSLTADGAGFVAGPWSVTRLQP